MNRTLRRPMFRIGGSAEGLTSGLAPRQGYAKDGRVQQVVRDRDLVNTLAPRKDTGLRDFLIDFGLDLASRPPQGGIFSTAAASAKDPFARFQAKKFQTEQSDRDLVTQLIKGMSEEERNAIEMEIQMRMKELGETRAIASQKVLDKRVHGVLKEEGEIKGETIASRARALLDEKDALGNSLIGYDTAMEIAEAAQGIFDTDGSQYDFKPSDIDTDQLYIEGDLIGAMERDEETGTYTVKTDDTDSDDAISDDYVDGMVYYNPRDNQWYRRDGKQFLLQNRKDPES